MQIEVHWRTLYSYGVWIPADAARVAVESGFSMMDCPPVQARCDVFCVRPAYILPHNLQNIHY